MKVREGERTSSRVRSGFATGVNNDGHRSTGVRVSTSETGPAWNRFFADLVARRLLTMRLVTSDAHHRPIVRSHHGKTYPGATTAAMPHHRDHVRHPKRYGPPSSDAALGVHSRHRLQSALNTTGSDCT